MADKDSKGAGKRAAQAALEYASQKDLALPPPPAQAPAFDENQFQSWYVPLATKLGIDLNPDDKDHFYDYRKFYQDMQAGKVIPPDQPGGHFPSTYKTEGHPRSYLDDGAGRVFDTRSTKYLTGEQVPDVKLEASEQSPDLPGFDPAKTKAYLDMFAARRGR